MTVTSVKDLTLNDKIRFRSKRADDTVNWVGTFLGMFSYEVARGFDNPLAYNNAVRLSDNTVSSDVTTLTYFLFKVDNNSTTSTKLLFADEWIQTGSLQVITPGEKVRLEVDIPDGDVEKVISLLASAKYKCKIIS